MGKGQKISGLSKATTSRSFKGRQLRTDVLKASSQHERKAAMHERRSGLIKEMSSEERALVIDMDTDHPMAEVDVDNYQAAFNSMPPGEEGYGISHEGGEHEVFEEFAHDLADLTGIHRMDDRNRRRRVETRNNEWEQMYEQLLDAYLTYRLDEKEELPRSTTDATKEGQNFNIEVVDLFHRRQQSFVTVPNDVYANVTLMRHGYIGSAPLHPSVALSIRTLAVYRQTHRVCPRLSIQAEVRKLCHLHNVPYRRYLCDQFIIAYDVYLEILSRVDARIKSAMGHDVPNWRLLNSCPACFYKLEGEPELEFSFLCEMDGNNSLKRTDATLRERQERIDTCGPRTDYWISPEDVDKFKDEVKRNPLAQKQNIEDSDDIEPSDDWEDVTESDPIATCIQRWRNAGPEERKRMFKLFDECGIFLVACRHGVVLLLCDMIKSGELAKYPLAMVDKLMEVYGSRIGAGYDIGCACARTVEKSSLGKKAEELRFRFLVGAFHGHAHNRGCQLDWHPLYVKGTGRADLEGCERIFSASNALAPGTRHSSKFHRYQAIEEHFGFWDDDKYAALSTYLFNHYKEALHVTDNWPGEINQMQQALGISDDDFHRYLDQERNYLRGLKAEPAQETLQFDYVEGLEALEKCRENFLKARSDINYLTNTPALSGLHDKLVKANRVLRSCQTKWDNADSMVQQVENQLQIEERWDPSSEQYTGVKEKLRERKFRRALDELERLVVQRLFELTKLNVSGTGYKMRTQISKALQRRSEAIRKALTRYNTAAASLSPPRPHLSWKEIVDYTFLGEFELLRHSRTDIRNQNWAEPAHREATVKYLQLQHAREEIIRLNVEIKSLRTAMHDESEETHRVLAELENTNIPLAAEIRKRWALRSAVNALHSARLHRIESLVGFSGDRGIGVRLGAPVRDDGAIHLPCNVDDVVVDEVLAGEVGRHVLHDEDDVLRELEGMTEFVSGIND